MSFKELNTFNSKLTKYFREANKSGTLTEEEKYGLVIVFRMLGTSIIEAIHEETKGEKK